MKASLITGEMFRNQEDSKILRGKQPLSKKVKQISKHSGNRWPSLRSPHSAENVWAPQEENGHLEEEGTSEKESWEEDGTARYLQTREERDFMLELKTLKDVTVEKFSDKIRKSFRQVGHIRASTPKVTVVRKYIDESLGKGIWPYWTSKINVKNATKTLRWDTCRQHQLASGGSTKTVIKRGDKNRLR